LRFEIPKQGEALAEKMIGTQAPAKSPRPKRSCDPKLVAAARELRDRWLERVNGDPSLLISQAKYLMERRPIAQAVAPAGLELPAAA
jgi:hypothetical protein